MSALPPKADMCGATRDVRYGPIADMIRPSLGFGTTAFTSTEISSPPAGGRFNLFLNQVEGIAIYSAEFTVAQSNLFYSFEAAHPIETQLREIDISCAVQTHAVTAI